MPKAKRVHSTPRRTASKIKAKKSAELTESEEQRNLRHGNAFRGLETPVRELFCISETPAISQWNRRQAIAMRFVHFSVQRLCEMVRHFHAKYREDHAKPAGGKAGSDLERGAPRVQRSLTGPNEINRRTTRRSLGV
jgi:hypothetical protein